MDVHPVARDVLDAFASDAYFRSNRLCQALAERSPKQCVNWAIGLVEFRINSSSPNEMVAHTLKSIHAALRVPSPDALSLLDELGWKSWSSDSFDKQAPFLQRAAARMAWATMCLICHSTSTEFKSQSFDLSGGDRNLLAEMASQCAMAVDITNSESEDGRLMVAASFSREMKDLS